MSTESEQDPTQQPQSTDTHSLYPCISLPLVFGSNIGPPGARDVNLECRKCIRPWDQRLDMSQWTESLAGGGEEQHGETPTMIINIPFSVPVRISSILINQGVGEHAPQRLQAYINRPNGLDTTDLNLHTTQTGQPSTGHPQADFSLRTQDSYTTSNERIQEYPLGRFAPRFASVNSISIVLSGPPQEEESTTLRLFYLNFRGSPPKEKPNPNDRISVHAEDAASTPLGRVKETARGAMSSVSGAAADGTGGQAR